MRANAEPRAYERGRLRVLRMSPPLIASGTRQVIGKFPKHRRDAPSRPADRLRRVRCFSLRKRGREHKPDACELLVAIPKDNRWASGNARIGSLIPPDKVRLQKGQGRQSRADQSILFADKNMAF